MGTARVVDSGREAEFSGGLLLRAAHRDESVNRCGGMEPLGGSQVDEVERPGSGYDWHGVRPAKVERQIPQQEVPDRAPGAKEESSPEGKRLFDGPEAFDLEERCLMSVAFGSSNATPPLIPNPFGLNFYQIVQTPQHVMILSELVHDVRIIRIGGKHLPPTVQLWRGDSIGRWEKGTLVVETTNFSEKSRYGGASEHLRVIERFTRTEASTISYRVTVEDPRTWVTPWTADIPFKATDERMFEFACHEANYSIANALRGARTEEKEGR